MKRITIGVASALVALLLACAGASAAETWPTQLGSSAPIDLQGCLNASGKVVACSDSTAVGSKVTNQTGTTTQAKVTIAVTNTYIQALAASSTRKGCTIQYVAVAGTKGYVFFGSAPADTTTSFQLTNGQSVNCQTPGVTLTDAVQVTGNGTDIFVVSNQ